MRLVSDKQVERTLRQIAFDELGGLVAAFTKTELHAGHRALHPLRLPVGKNQLPPVVHQIDEVMQVVTQHPGQKDITEHLHHFLCGGFTQGWDTLYCASRSAERRVGKVRVSVSI